MADGGKVENGDENLKNNAEANDLENKHWQENDGQELDFENIEEYSVIARKPENSTIHQNILEFFFSYAYNCRKYFNLCVVDMNTLAFATGNFIQFFNVAEKIIWFKRGSVGTGIGHILKNPAFEHIAVAANGINPLITIYNWPSMKIVAVLKEGTTKRYFHLTYSSDGLLLGSQGGEPDYYISIWNWKEAKILLQCKSYVQDVYNIMFSKFMPGQLTSSGVGHIKFWKMSKTFTGLKLKGEVGKFGNTEISDIIAIHPMPNETVISGCEWGNILLWDENLIKLQACKKNKETAHSDSINQFEYINGELISVGSDGWIRFWFYETIDHANLSDEEQFLEIQPIYEFEITEKEKNSMLMCIGKQEPDKPGNTMWYAQDGNGGIWLLDLCTSGKEQLQRKVFTCHAGPIADMDTADWGSFIATLDKSGRLHIYNYIEKTLNIVYKFGDAGSQVIWLPCVVEKTGSTLICAFESGIIRMIVIAIHAAGTENNVDTDYTKLVQVLKPHTMPITVMSLNTSCNLLVTGSNDSIIFVFNINSTETYPTIVPIGYVRLPSSATYMTWNPQEETTLLVGCFKGDCVEVKLPLIPQSYTTTSYELIKCNPISFKFVSVKSAIEREAIQKKYDEERERKLEERRKQIEQLRVQNPHIIIDEETFLMDFDEEEMILPEIYIPDIPNQVLVAQYGINGNLWLFMAGFDAGYVYEYPCPLTGKLKHNKPIRSKIIEYARDAEIHNFLYHESNTYLFMGTQYGQLYLTKINKNDPLDFSDCWILQIHDYYNGHMSKILFSYDKTMLLTCGYDGNIFCFKIHDDIIHKKGQTPKAEMSLHMPENVEDIEDPDYPCLEEVITKLEQDRMTSFAEKRKEQILGVVRDLTEEYVKITGRNKQLLESQQISQFELDPRIAEELEQQLNVHIILTQEKLKLKVEKSKLKLQKLMDHFVTPITCLPFAVYGMLNECRAVHSLREIRLDTDNILNCMEMMKQYETQQETSSQHGRIIQEQIKEKKYLSEEKEIQYLEGLLAEDFSDLSSGLGLQINQMLLRYKEKKARLIQQQNEWRQLNERKPNMTKTRLEDEAFLAKAEQTIGKYNLRMNADDNLAKRNEAAAMKYKQLLNCRNKLYYLRKNFNAKLKTIALEKQQMQKEVIKITEDVSRIHMEIPLKSVRPLPCPPKLNLDIEFPEHNLEPGKYISISEKMQQVKRQRQSLTVNQSTDHSDVEYEVLYCDKMNFEEGGENLDTVVSQLKVSSTKLKKGDSLSAHGDLIKNLNISDSISTIWEREMKRSRIWRKMHEQDSILRYIDNSYIQVENKLDELEEYRLDVIYQSIYMNLNVLTLYEEFIILRDCETRQHALEEKVNQKSDERLSVILKMQDIGTNIAIQEEIIRKLQTRIKDIAMEFIKSTADNKFQDFLQKIFKKKYTAVKKKDGSLDSAAESSETSSEESDGTIDSEAEYIPFDESICPQGCDRELYEKAFSVRTKRYEYEFQIKEGLREIELLQKELEANAKLLKVIDSNLRTNQEKLQSFMLEKQRKLNDISITIILKLHQLQHVLDLGYTTEIQNCIVFNKKDFSNLYGRIGELQDETHNLEEKRKKNLTHLKGIKLDLKYMQTQNKKLEEHIRGAMIQKFGQRVSLITLYETILQRLIYDTKTDVRTIMKNFNKDIKNMECDYKQGLIVLKNLIRNNTEKLNLLTVLQKEKLKLRKILEQTLSLEENMLQIELDHKSDITVLQNILYNQSRQKCMLQYDIKNFKTSPKKVPAYCLKQI